jgi:hypothetical protein
MHLGQRGGRLGLEMGWADRPGPTSAQFVASFARCCFPSLLDPPPFCMWALVVSRAEGPWCANESTATGSKRPYTGFPRERHVGADRCVRVRQSTTAGPPFNFICPFSKMLNSKFLNKT